MATDATLAPKPFGQRLTETGRLSWLAVRLSWNAGPPLITGIALLLALQAAIAPAQLAATRAVIDAAARQLGLVTTLGRLRRSRIWGASSGGLPGFARQDLVRLRDDRLRGR